MYLRQAHLSPGFLKMQNHDRSSKKQYLADPIYSMGITINLLQKQIPKDRLSNR
jgi:hypothetical protein